MIRPLTCLSLVAALGAGLYLYQEKHRAQLLDRDITRTVKQADQARDRIGLLKAEWALLNEPERLAGLAAQHLQLQPLQPTQFARLEDLRGRLPPISLAPAAMPVTMDEPPVAAVTPAQPPRTQLAAAQPVATPVPARPAPVVTAAAPAAIPVKFASLPAAVAAQPTPVLPNPVPPAPVQLAAAHPPAPRPVAPHLQLAAKPHEAEPVAHATEPARRPLFAPVMPAYAPTPVAIHAPTVQTASAMGAPSSVFVGSALGMGRTVLAAPVPVSSAAALGYASER